MANQTDRQAKQRFVALRVNEVSLVDHPANEREFLVIKRTDAEAQKAKWSAKQVNDLPDDAFLHIKTGGKKDGEGKTVPRDLRMFPYKGPDGAVDLPHLRNALARIPDSDLDESTKQALTARGEKLLADADHKEKNMATKTDAEKAAEQEAAKKAETEKAAAAKAESEKAEKAKQEQEAAKKAADDLAAAEKSVADAQAQLEAVKAKAPPFKKKPGNAAEDAKDGGADDAEEEKKKAAEAAKATTKSTEVQVTKQDPKSMLIQMMCDDMIGRIYKLSSLAGMDVDNLLAAAKSMGASEETISKMQTVAKSGKKQLSSERMEKFNQSLKGLMEIAKDADPDKLAQTLKDMMASLGGGSALEPGHENSPKPPPVTETTADGNGYTATSAVKAVKEAEEKLAKAQADLAELKKKVEALEGATATTKALDGDTTTTQKSKPSMWKGIL